MPFFFRQRRPLPRRGAAKAESSPGTSVAAFLRKLPLRKSVLAIVAVQTSIQSLGNSAGADNLATMLLLLDKVQTYGGHKDICLFPAVALPGDALPVLVQAARRYNCTLVFGIEGTTSRGGRLTITIAPTGEVRLEHAVRHDASVLTLRTRQGTYRAVACGADAWYSESIGLTTAIHSPDGRAIVASRSRAEQAVAAVLHVGPDRTDWRPT